MDASVWSDAQVAEAFHDVFVPLRVQGRAIYSGEAPDVKEIVGMQPAYLTILDAETNVLATAPRAPFSDVDGALEWVEEITTALDETSANEEAFKEDPDNLELMKALVSSYYVLGKHKEFEYLSGKLLPHLGDDEAIDLKLRMVKVQMNLELQKAMKDPTSWSSPEKAFAVTRELAKELAEELLEAKDERIFDLLFDKQGGILAMAMQNEAFELAKRVFEVFPEHERLGESILQLSMVAMMSQDKEVKSGIIKMMEDYVADASDDDPNLENMQMMLQSIKAFSEGLKGLGALLPKEDKQPKGAEGPRSESSETDMPDSDSEGDSDRASDDF